jgi:hypothetical protein
MKPIAQTFIINEPDGGVEAVFLKRLDLFFQSKSNTFGIEMQIRETQNGFPTQTMVPYGKAYLNSSDVLTSQDASVATPFYFNTPIIIKTNVQYAIIVAPIGGNPDYNVWIGQLGGNDVTTGAPIIKGNQTGNLFISSNDLNFTPIQNESMKYNLYIAKFLSAGAVAVFKNTDTDFLRVKDTVGSFYSNERVVVANNGLELASISVAAGGSNTYVNTEIVFQPNTATNYLTANAYGTVYFANTTKILLKNVVGSFSNTTTLKGTINGYLVTPNNASQTVTTTSACNVIAVPDANTTYTTDFAVNNVIYVGANTRSGVQVLQITAVNGSNNTITVDSNVNFTDTDAVIGRVKSDAKLFGYVSSVTRSSNYKTITVKNVNANTTQNFANSQNKLLIGRDSGATANIESIFDISYESVTPQIGSVQPTQTATAMTFAGTSNTRVLETGYLDVVNYVPLEFIDKQRIIMSRSNELAFPVSGGVGAGTKSVTFNVSMATSNNRISPYIDRIKLDSAYTTNYLTTESQIEGYNVQVANSTGLFTIGETVWQSNATVNTYATILYCNSSYLQVSNVQSNVSTQIGTMNANGTSILTGETSGTIANVISAGYFSETGDIVNPKVSRYISKNAVLAEGQDAEDVVALITAYRPPSSNLKVYAKVISATDPDKFPQKDWSAMPETSSPSLQSSAVDRNDLVELTYDLPSTVQLIPNSAVVSTTSSNIAMSSTSGFRPGDFIYFVDSGANGKMNIRQVIGVTNSTSLALSSNAGFSSSNCAVGNIPGLESRVGAFRYSNNYSICRYVSSTDVVYDSIKTFAVKVVLVSDDPVAIPRMADIRCLALQI